MHLQRLDAPIQPCSLTCPAGRFVKRDKKGGKGDGSEGEGDSKGGGSATVRSTGQMGDVMRESSQIAHTFARSAAPLARQVARCALGIERFLLLLSGLRCALSPMRGRDATKLSKMKFAVCLSHSALFVPLSSRRSVSPLSPHAPRTSCFPSRCSPIPCIALDAARSYLYKLQPENDFLETTPLHVHVPEGATPKDGPSAGITMVTSFLSLAMDMPPRSDLAMTGELTLTGRVLAIGGVREKLIAARRSGVQHIIFPKANERDYTELPQNLRDGVQVYFAQDYDDVFRIAFPQADGENAS
eukprot:6211311-Pleurochrysis_carterae.AAC.2